MHHDRGNMTRAVLEGVAFNLRTGLHAFRDGGIDIASVDAIGGAAHAELLLTTFADVWGVPVASRNLVDEATSVGAAVVGGVGIGLFESFEIATTMSHRTNSREPVAERVALYERTYPLFIDAYLRLEDWFEDVAAL